MAVANEFLPFCPTCLGGPQVLDPDAAALIGEDFLADRGGVIVLRDSTSAVVDEVGYGNLGGAPVSCPLLQPLPFGSEVLGRQGVEGKGALATEYDTTAMSGGRSPDGDDIGNDAADFDIGRPTPNASNTPVTAAPDLGSSVRINGVYAYDPRHTAVQFYNPRPVTVDIGGWMLSDGYFIRPLFPSGVQDPIEPAHAHSVYQGLNGEIGFQLDADSRLDLYEPRSEGLVRVDQLGWMRVPSFFPDNCMVRVPPGSGPSGGWDWNTSGGFVSLFYVANCELRAPGTPVGPAPAARASLAPAWPNPAWGTATVAFTVGEKAGRAGRVQLSLLDVSGRAVRRLADRVCAPGQYSVTWDGRAEDGSPAPSGVYFVRLSAAGVPGAEVRTLVWLRP